MKLHSFRGFSRIKPKHESSFVYPSIPTPSNNCCITIHPDQQTFCLFTVDTSQRLSITQIRNKKVISQKLMKLAEKHSLFTSSNPRFLTENSLIIGLSNSNENSIQMLNLKESGQAEQVWRIGSLNHNAKWCIDFEDNQIYVYMKNEIRVFSIMDGNEITKFDFPEDISLIEIDKTNSKHLVIVTRVNVIHLDKNTHIVFSIINVEKLLLEKLLKSCLFRIQSMTQDENGNTYLAVHWYSPMIFAHSGCYDSSFYLVTLRNERIVAYETELTKFETRMILYGSNLLCILEKDSVSFVKMRGSAIFEKMVTSIYSDVNIELLA